MSEPFVAAAVQMTSGEDRTANLTTAERLIEEAAACGAQLIALPEMFTCYGRPEAIVRAAETLPGPTGDWLSALAARLQVVLIAGSLPERSNDPARVYNTSLVFGPDGSLLGHYRKLHLFDVDLADGSAYRESSWCIAGERVSLVDSPPARIGQAICYDLRFPELFRALSAGGAQVVAVASAFTASTGRDHWEALVRARAIENQVYVLAPNQCGTHAEKISTYGHSLIVDPWGEVLACAIADEEVITATIDLSHLANIRARMPVHTHRRM